jgi:hypothetical protein
MRKHTIDAAGLRMLRGLVGGAAKQLVWDLDAVYVVRGDGILRIGQKLGLIESPATGEREDIWPVKAGLCGDNPVFKEEGEPGKSYWVVAVDEPITRIEIVRVAIRFPAGPGQWEVVPPSSVDADARDVELIDCGVFIHTPVGVLPAFPGVWFAFGFRHDGLVPEPSISLVDPQDAVAMLPEGYELVPLPGEP